MSSTRTQLSTMSRHRTLPVFVMCCAFGALATIALPSTRQSYAQQPGGLPPRGAMSFPTAPPFQGNSPVVQNRQSFSPAPQNGVAPVGNYSVPDARLAAATNNSSIPSTNASTAAEGATTEPKIPVRSLLQMFHDGGFMMYPIALCSFVLMVFSFERFIHLRTGRVIPRPFVRKLIEQLQQQQIDKEEALELCERNPSPIATIMIAAVKRYGRPAVEVEQAVLDAGERETNNLRKHMRLLNAISNVSPLLGLLGTVFGMIQSFNDISNAQAMGRPEALAGGISEALLTTAAGLLVAIPAYLMYMYFLGHTDKLTMEMDHHAQKLVEAICAEGLAENDSSRNRSRARKAA